MKGKELWTKTSLDAAIQTPYVKLLTGFCVSLSIILIGIVLAFNSFYNGKMAFLKEIEQIKDFATVKLQEDNAKLVDHISDLESVETQSKVDIVNYILANYKTTPRAVATQISHLIINKSTEHNVPVVAIMGIMEVESQYNPYSVSTAGARGLMQVMWNVHKKMLKETNGLKNRYGLHGLELGIDSGVRVIRMYLTDCNNNMKKALYKYLGGPNPMRKGWKGPTIKQKVYARDVFAAMGRFGLYRSFASLKTAEPEEEKVEEKEVKKLSKVDMIKAQKSANEYVEIKPVENFLHTVKFQGDSLSLISKWYTGAASNWKQIAAANPSVVPERMMIGQTIYIPENLLNNRLTMPKSFIAENRPKVKIELPLDKSLDKSLDESLDEVYYYEN